VPHKEDVELNSDRPNHWVIRNKKLFESPDDLESFQKQAKDVQNFLGVTPLTAKLLVSRGITEEDQARDYLNLSLKNLPDPFLMKDMDKGVALVLDAIINKRKITVWGDYDVDGTTGATLLERFFKEMDVDVTVYQPNRSTEGYGINPQGIEKLFNEGRELIISVDCGISSFEAAQKAKELGLTLVVTDHHRPKEELPVADAVINPNRNDDESGLGVLAGVGVGFYFAIALRKSLREQGFFENHAEPNLRKLLDLVAVGTIADVASLTGVNRILVKEGLKVLEHTDKPGFKSLMEKANVKTPILPYAVGFQIGPRINAAGRVGSPEIAFRLLSTESKSEADKLASELEAMNSKRRGLQESVWTEVKEKVEELKDLKNLRSLVVASPDWHEGVIGIVASKMVERYSRPSIVITIPEEGPAKGSVRTFGKIQILNVIEACKEHLLEFGGHAAAAGLTIEIEKLEDFKKAFNDELLKLDESEFKKDIVGDLDVDVSELSSQVVKEIELLGPFGQGNPEPVFFTDVRSEKALLLKGKHMKLKVSSKDQKRKQGLDAIGFNLGETHDLPDEGGNIRLAFTAGLNAWAGKISLQLSIKDIEI
jgi:single-stranded-DNA-specific exonuclease